MLNFQFQGNRKLRDELTSSRLNAILTELRRIRPVAGRGINIQQEGNGTRISALDSFVSGAGGSRRQPWDIYVSDTEGEEDAITYTLKVQPGTISGILPANWNDEFTAQSDEVYYGVAEITTDGQDLTGVSIDISTEVPNFATPELFSVPTSVKLLFGFGLNTKTFRVFAPGSPTVRPRPWITLEKPSSQPGELPYDIYYTLLP